MASSPGATPTPPPPASSAPPTSAEPPPSTSPPPSSDTSPPPPDSPSPPPPVAASPPPAEAPPPPPPPQSTPQAPPPSTPAAPPPPPPPSTPEAPPPATPSPPPPESTPPPSPSPPPKSSPSPPPPSGGESPAPATSSTPPPPSASPPSSSVVPSAPAVHSPPPPKSPNSPPSNSSSIIPSSPSTLNKTSYTTSTTPSSGGSSGVKYGLALGIVAAVVVIGFMMVIVYLQRRKRRKQRYNPYIMPSPFSSSQGSGSSVLIPPYSSGGNDSMGDFKSSNSQVGGMGNSKTWFSYEELSLATNGFSSQNILGAGGFGCVYKGYLEDGREVAVKKLKAGGGQGDREFKAEVEIISRVHHRHLVTLVGYCINELQRLLVYEFVPNNTLYYHLHGSRQVLQWSLRVKVGAGSAKGLAYLHEDCHPRIIHRDIKTANILLDNSFEAKVADFGLAKLAEELDANTHVSTRVMGTFGYMAPEYASSGKLTEKSDVFSFGVVLLELITGRKPVDESQPLGDESLVEWARPLLTQALDTQEFDEIADPRLEGNYDRAEMFRMIEAAAACVRHSATKRPKLSQVARALDLLSEASADLSNGMRPGQSEVIDTREQSAQIRMFRRMAFGSQDISSEYFNDSKASWSGARR